MLKLLKYLHKYRRQAITAPFFKLLEVIFELFVPLVVARIIDIGIACQDRNYVVRMCLLLGLLAVIGFSCTLAAQYFAARTAAGFARDVKHDLFDHIQSFSYRQLDKVGTSTLITRLTSDMNQIQTGINLSLRLLLRSPFVVFGAMVMAFTIDVSSTLIFVLIIPVLSVIIFFIMLKTVPLYQAVQNQLDRVLKTTRENLTGNRVIRAFNLQKQEMDKYGQQSNVLNALLRKVGRISALMNPLTYVIINIGVVTLLYVGALKVNSGTLSSGQVVALYNYMSQILVELVKLANLIITITKSFACGNRVQAILDEQADPETVGEIPQPSGDYIVEFDHVSLKYHHNALPALYDIRFQVRSGETIGIIGSTGCGKSSVINLIENFYQPTEGRVLIKGADARNYPGESLRKMIGIVPQRAVLFSGTVRSNLLWGNESASDEELIEALKQAEGFEIVERKQGLDTVVEQNGTNFSGGQRQRLTIARALVRRPDILILDDSASALDFATEARLRKTIRSLDYHPTCFIVSQRTSSIMHADKILVMEDGRLVMAGTHEELLRDCEVYQEIYYSQFRKEEEAYAQ
ncbi:MAG: ABC transporter ATP-binding protein/permease [Erysipelotrichaceae bacterium]|nr:ABC transporter ATP-binding protein/permease [Erysipelotrichaceae bacterium]